MTRRLFTIEQDEQIAGLYLQNYSTHKLAKIYNCDKSAISNALKRQNIVRRNNRELTDSEEQQILKIYQAGYSRRKIAIAYNKSQRLIKDAINRQSSKEEKLNDARFNYTESEEQQIAKIYNAGYTITHIAKSYGCLHKTIRKALERQKIEIRKTVAKPKILKGRQPAKNPITNLSAFDNLDNEASLYWLGFCYADTDTTKYQLRVGLAIKDKEQVEGLSDFLGCNRDKIKTTSATCSAEFTSKYIANKLKELGIIARRGEFYRIADKISQGLEHHFIRGYLDGDGCISDREKVIFLGQPDILNWIKSQLVKYAQASNKVEPRQRRGIHEISWGGGLQFTRVVNYIYQDATIYMQRKKIIADKTKRG